MVAHLIWDGFGMNSMLNDIEVGIESIEYELGEIVTTNEVLNAENPGWDMEKTVERTGVLSRPIAAEGTTALDLAEKASKKLFEKHPKLSLSDIDALIFCTQSPDFVLPPNSTLLQERLGLPENVMAFDISHACSGFMYSIGIARSLVMSRTATKVLVVNADTYSRFIHPIDRSIRPLFGDGASAALISSKPIIDIIDISFGTSGKHADRFIIKNGGARFKRATDLDPKPDNSNRIYSPNHIYMDGMGVLSFFNSVIPRAVREILVKNNLSIDDIGVFVFHQASKLALDGIKKSLKIPDSKFIFDISHTGNLVSASIPVAISNSIKCCAIKSGQLGILCGFGVGLSWSTALVKVK